MRLNTFAATIFASFVGSSLAFSSSRAFVARSENALSVTSLKMSDDAFVPETEEATQSRIQELVDNNPVLLFMKGSKVFPQCGFSSTAVQILNAYNIDFHTVGE